MCCRITDQSPPLMGFGHRIYRTHDPRSLALREVLKSSVNQNQALDLAIAVEEAAVKVLEEEKPGKESVTMFHRRNVLFILFLFLIAAATVIYATTYYPPLVATPSLSEQINGKNVQLISVGNKSKIGDIKFLEILEIGRAHV